MKTIIAKFLVLGICMISFQACNSDDDDHDYSISLTTVVPLQVTGSNTPFYLLRDNGTALNPKVNDVASYVAKSNQRAFAWYYTLEDRTTNPADKKYDIRLLQISNVLTKGTIKLNASNADSIGNDPVRVLDIWSGGGFMNIQFSFYTDGVTTHYINLVENTLNPPATDGKIHLELRHNARGASDRGLVSGFVCFNITPYQQEGKQSVDFVISVREFSGTKTYNITYNYATTQEQSVDMTNIMEELSATKYQ